MATPFVRWSPCSPWSELLLVFYVLHEQTCLVTWLVGILEKASFFSF